MATNITAHLIAYNVERLRFPWIASIASALPICDQVIVCECGSDDDTPRHLETWAAMEPKLRIIHGPWAKSQKELVDLVNLCVAEVRTGWQLLLQADEVVHEADYPEITRLPQEGKHIGYTFHRRDFISTFDIYVDDLIDPPRCRLAPRGWSPGGMESDLTGTGPAVPSRVRLYHYGKVALGRMPEVIEKENSFQQIYTGNPDVVVRKAKQDGYMDYFTYFQDAARSQGGYRKLLTPHPAAMQGYLKRMNG